MQTKREYAASLGLAQLGVRGRLSAAANQAILEAQKNGMRFSEPAAKVISRPSITTTEYDVDLGDVRKWAIERGYPVKDRGRISRVIISEYAKEKGAKTLSPERKAEKKAEKAIASKPKGRGRPAVHNIYEDFGITPAEVREWAKANGIAVNPRGMIKSTIVEDYINAKGLKALTPDEVNENKAAKAAIVEKERAEKQEKIQARISKNVSKQRKVVANVPSTPVIVKRVQPKKVRPETVGYTYAERGPEDGKHISEPLVAVTTCGDCSKGVAYCGCAQGPMAPKYLGRKPLMLVKP